MVFFLRRPPPVRVPGKVVLFGSSSAVGEALSLSLKLCPLVRDLRCCASMPAARGPAVDLSHIDTTAAVSAAVGAADWPAALRGAALVLFCGEANARGIAGKVAEVAEVAEAVAAAAPAAVVGIVTGPVNVLVPAAREVLVRRGRFDPRKLFGVTTLDVLRTRVLVAHALQMNPFDVNVPVVGGRGGRTACPLIGQTGLRIPHERIVSIAAEVQACGGEEGGQEHLAMASAAHEWAVSVLKAMRGDCGIIECGLVESTMRREVPFFSSRVELGTEGVARILPMGPLTSHEEELIEAAVPLLAEEVEAGIATIAANEPKILPEK